MSELKFTLSILFILLTSSLFGFESYYHTTKVLEGEGSYALMRRFSLDVNACNLAKFYELNKLSNKTPLQKGKEYILPIQIVKYNGKSIRSTINIDDWDTAVSIKEYNERIKKNKLRKTHYIDSKILWVPHHIYCDNTSTQKESATSTKTNTKSSVKPIAKAAPQKIAKGNVRHQPIFGKKYASVTIEDESLKGKVYYIVSGHGGPDPGACCGACSNALCEDEYAYDIALRLARNLISKGATTHIIIQDKDGIRDDEVLICDTDELCMGTAKIPAKQLPRLQQRVSKINALYSRHKSEGVKEQYAIILHIDSNHKDKRRDVYFYHHKKSKTGKKLAKHMLKTFKNKYDEFQKGRGYKGFTQDRNLYVIRNTHPPVLFLELGNINNPSDQKRIQLVSNRQALADWLTDGMSTFK